MEMKETKIGFCIPDFDPIRLKDFLSSNDAGKWGADPTGENDIAVVRSTNFNDTGYLDLSDVSLRSLPEDDYKKTKLLENDIVIERSGGSANQPVGRVSFVTKEIEDTGFGFSNFIQRIRVSDEHNAKYVFYCLYHLHSAGITQTMQTQTNGIRNLEYRYYLNQKLPKPSPTEQTRIANLLSSVDKTIQATKNSIAKLEKLKTSLMQNLLTGKMKPDGTWRREEDFQITKRGKIPKNWTFYKINQISTTYSGATPSRSNEKFYYGDIPWVKSGEVNQSFIYDTEEKISLQAFESSSTKWVEPETILFAMYGATAGQLAILKVRACTNQAVLAIPINDSSLFYRDYVLFAIEVIVPFLITVCQGSGQPNLSKTIIDKSYIAVPNDIEEQKEIAKHILSVLETIYAKRIKIDKFNLLKKSLMQNLLTGKVRIPQEALKKEENEQ